MKTEHKIIAVSAGLGLLFWGIDAVLDYLLFYEDTLLGLLITDVPTHEIYIRCVVLAGSVTFGVFVSSILAKRNRAQEAQREAGETSQQYLDIAGVIVVAIDGNGKVTLINRKGCEVLGYEEEEIIGNNWRDIFAPEWPKEHLAPAAEPALIGEIEATKDHESLILTRSGEERLIAWHSIVIKDEDGNTTGHFSSGEDITERRRAEEELEDVFSLSRNMVAVCTIEGRFLKVNPACEKVLGYTQEELLDLGWSELVHPDDAEATTKVVEEQLQGSRVANFVNRYRCKDGSYKTLEWQATFAKEGIVHATARDITERKRTEEALLASEARYRGLFHNSPISLWEEDFSKVKVLLDDLRSSGVSDMRAHLKSHPDVVSRCAGLVDVLDINNATVALLEAATKGEILGSLGKLLKDAVGDVFREEICSLYDGKEGFVSAMVGRSLKGTPMDCVVRGTVAPGYERSWSRVLVSVTDITELKRAEKRLQANQYYLTKAQEIGMIGTWELDVQDDILIWTDENYRIFGVPLGTEMSYELFLNCVHPDDRDYVHESWSAGLDHMPYDIEHRIMVADEVKWVREKADVEFDSEGNPTVAIGVTQDITERRRVADELSKERILSGAIIDKIPVMLTRYDPDTNILYLNQEFEKVVGWTTAEVEDIDLMEKVYPDPDYRRQATEYMQEASSEWREFRVQSKSGRIVDSEWSNIRLDDGTQIGIGMDITERKRAEEALRESEERFRGYVETSQDLIWESDAEGIITYLNPAWEKVTGYRASELLGKSYFDLLAEEEVERERAQFAENPKGVVNGRPAIYITKTGSEILLIFNTIPLYDASKNIIGTLGSAYDVTERVRAEKALRESNRRLEETLAALRDTQEQMMHQERLAAVGQLSAGIAHDFNNILASIVLYTQMSLGTNELSATTRQRLEVIAQEADRAAELVQQMLDFGRQAVLRREVLSLQPLLGKTVALLERTLPENVRLDLASGPGEYMIDADPARVQQAIVNLALNARDAMPDGGELHVALSRVEDGEFDCVDCGRVVGGDWVQVTVRDTGRGIAPDVLPHIFEPFFTTRAPLGHGLGLAQVYGIVVQHGGHIEVETAVGRGTTFRLYWPATSVAQLEAPALRHPDAAQGKGQTVLVVEDNAMMRTALLDVMDMLGYRVLEAANGREALVVCEQHIDDISLVLSDWVMPQMGGLALVRELERRDVAVKVLMLTGHPLDNETKMAVPTSVVGWLLKPVDLDQLAEAVAQALAGAGA